MTAALRFLSTMFHRPGWTAGLSLAAVALAGLLQFRTDHAHLAWAAELSTEGSPPPALDPTSSTGYVLGERQFLATHERGSTYRWIAATQDFLAPRADRTANYEADNVPLGRPRLQPSLETAWLAAITGGLHLVTGDPAPLCAERAALWEPLISHLLALLAVTVFLTRRFGLPVAAWAALCFALFPPLAAQFLPGVLTARLWALLFAAYALALSLPAGKLPRPPTALGVRAAAFAALALWLDPALGFPAIVSTAIVGALPTDAPRPRRAGLIWAGTGALVTIAAWLLDGATWSISAGELRYVHPLYACAWLGLGGGLDAWHRRSHPGSRRATFAGAAAAIALLTPLAYVQLRHDYPGWLYPSAAMGRLASLDETVVYHSLLDWIGRVPGVEVAFVLAPLLIATLTLLFEVARPPQSGENHAPRPLISAIVLAGIVALAVFRIRWCVVGALVSAPVVADFVLRRPRLVRRAAATFAAIGLFALLAWGRDLPSSLRLAAPGTPPSPADLEALVHRHFSRWMASHHPGRKINALAPPELADSLVFHGGCHVLMSTAWESYSGQVAASRILSAPEASEAEAVLQSREITHVILTSWDTVLPLLVRPPDDAQKDTLYARLQRWIAPPYLRPMPYQLPANSGYAAEKLVVFAVTAPQDEALQLSRLAEYFVEMNRAEPAALAARVLARSFPDDPNATIARALVAAQARDRTDFARQLDRLEADVAAGRHASSWDRRVQRAIVLALGRRSDVARPEIEACLATATGDDLFALTPLQAYRLRVLGDHFDARFADATLTPLIAALGAEFAPEAR